MTDDKTGASHEPSHDSSDRTFVGRSSDSSDADNQPGGSNPPSLATNGRLSPKSDERLPEHDAIVQAVEEGIGTELQTISASISRSGPLPDVAEFKGYEAVLPGAAERIMAMAELNAQVAAEMTRADAAATLAAANSVTEDGKAVKRGQTWFGVLSLLLIGIAALLALNGADTSAAVVAIVGMLSGFGILIRPVNGQRWRPKD